MLNIELWSNNYVTRRLIRNYLNLLMQKFIFLIEYANSSMQNVRKSVVSDNFINHNINKVNVIKIRGEAYLFIHLNYIFGLI